MPITLKTFQAKEPDASFSLYRSALPRSHTRTRTFTERARSARANLFSERTRSVDSIRIPAHCHVARRKPPSSQLKKKAALFNLPSFLLLRSSCFPKAFQNDRPDRTPSLTESQARLIFASNCLKSLIARKWHDDCYCAFVGEILPTCSPAKKFRDTRICFPLRP